MRHRSIATLLLGGVAAASLLTMALPAGASGPSVKVTPDKNLVKGETVKVTGVGFPYATDGAPNSFFMAECTSAVKKRLATSDTGHCNIGAVQTVKMSKNGTFTTRIKLVTGAVGDGVCGKSGHLTCVIGVGDLTQQGSVADIYFK